MVDRNEKMLMKGRSGRQFMILVLVALAYVSSGCRKQEARERQELEFTVCAETELPDDLRQIIEEKKLHAFQMSYTTKDHLYIVTGYGEHDRSNLCVVVEELYKTDRAIYIKTDLKTEAEMKGEITGAASGTDPDMAVGQTGTSSMYPYIVIRLPRLELPVLKAS